MKRLIIIRGPLGVGKTTISKKVAERFHAVYISVDELIDTYGLSTDDGIPLSSFLQVNEHIRSLISQSDNEIYIVDGNFYYQEQLDDMIQHHQGECDVITLVADVETCIMRDKERKTSYGEDATRYVYMMTMKIVTDTIIYTDQKTIENVLQEVCEKIHI